MLTGIINFLSKPTNKQERPHKKEIEQLSQLLNEMRDHPVEDQAILDPHNDPFTRMTLHVQGLKITKDNQEITKLILYTCYFDKDVYVRRVGAEKTLIQINYTNGRKEIVSLTPTNEHSIFYVLKISKLISCFMSLGCSVDSSFSAQSIPPHLIEWKKEKSCDVYRQTCFAPVYYQNLRNYAANWLLKTVNENDNLHYKASDHGIQLFSFGCGDARDLSSAKEAFTHKGYACKGYGFDINPENFKKAAKDLTLEELDFSYLPQFLEKHATFSPLKIGLFVGTLVHGVMKGPRQALEVFHQTWGMDIIFIGGFSAIFLNSRIFKAVGYEVSCITTNSEMQFEGDKRFKREERGYIMDCRNAYMLKAMDDTTRKMYLQNRSAKYGPSNPLSTLDLSYSGDPIRDISLFAPDEIADIEEIDLSWSYMDKQMLGSLSEKLNQLRLKKAHIIISGCENWRGEFDLLLENGFTFIERNQACNHSIPSISPQVEKRIVTFNGKTLQRKSAKL